MIRTTRSGYQYILYPQPQAVAQPQAQAPALGQPPQALAPPPQTAYAPPPPQLAFVAGPPRFVPTPGGGRVFRQFLGQRPTTVCENIVDADVCGRTAGCIPIADVLGRRYCRARQPGAVSAQFPAFATVQPQEVQPQGVQPPLG